MRYGHKREIYIPKGSVKFADKQSSAVVYLYQRESSGKLGAVGFHGNAQKPDWQYTFRDAAQREAYCGKHFEAIRAREKARGDRARERVAFKHSCQVGDIYRTSWGYDQTNVEFFEVIEVRGKYAILREIAGAVRENGQGSESVVAQSGAFLEPKYKGDDRGVPIRRLIQERHIKIGDVRSAWPWGKRIAGVVVGPAVHQTASGWGH